MRKIMSLNNLYVVRDATAEDANFVLSTFLRGIYYGNDLFNLIPKAVFMESYKDIARKLFYDQTKTTVKVACLVEDQRIIIGYSILSADYLNIHYVYVKQKFRKQGIAKSLLPKYPVSVSHLTEIGKNLMITKFPDTHYNPFTI